MQKDIISLFWNSTRPYKLKLFLAVCFTIIAVSLTALVGPYILSLFLDQLQSGSVSIDNSLNLILTYAILVFVGEVVIWRFSLYFTWTFEVDTMRDIYQKIFRKLSRETMQFHASRFGGALVSQSNKFIGSYERFWDMIIWTMTPMLTSIIGAVAVLWYLSYWQYALFLLLLAVGFGVAVFVSSRFLADRNKREAQASTKSTGYLADVVTNIATVKSFGREKYELSQAAQYNNDWRDKSFSLKWGVIKATSIYASFLAVIQIAALLFAVVFASNSTIAIGSIYLMFVYTMTVGRQMWEMNNIVRTYNRVIGDSHDMTEILLQPNDITDVSDAALTITHGKIDFTDVAFTHDAGEGERVFKNFTLSIPAGQRVGIVGHSGSGKTTLTRLLLRFSDVDTGTIAIDDQDIAKVAQQSLHESIAYVSQEPMLFHRSLSENIAYGKPDATADEVRHAAQLAHADEFIQSLPHKYDTPVGERGVKLSGGQRQRIAIARAILKDAPILVLDEATSALDSESEKLIQQSLETLMKGRTSIVIAHRLSTIAKLDRIIVLDHGRIVEDGTHGDLLQKKSVYARLWSHQSGGFIEE